jgi:hypothetical protein
MQSPLRFRCDQLVDMAECPYSPGGYIRQERMKGVMQEELYCNVLRGRGKCRPTRGSLSLPTYRPSLYDSSPPTRCNLAPFEDEDISDLELLLQEVCDTIVASRENKGRLGYMIRV